MMLSSRHIYRNKVSQAPHTTSTVPYLQFIISIDVEGGIPLCSFCSNDTKFESTEITEVNLSALVYRLFHEDFSSIDV